MYKMNLKHKTINKAGIITILVSLTVLPIASQTTVSLDEVKLAGLHVIEISTNNNEEPQGTIIESEWQPGTYNITYKNKVPCRIVISLLNDILFDSGPYEKKSSGATIRINGNTSAFYSDPLNMPYKIKLEKANDLLCRGNNDKYSDKHWRLLKDATSLNTIVGLKLSQLIGLEWTAAYIPCNVIINGDYRGCYLLMETVKQNNLCRINCDKKVGYIVERDPYWWKEEKYFSSQWYCDESMYRWTWSHPDEEDLNETIEQYVQQYIIKTEQSINDGNYNEYIDISSWTKWLLAHDILGTRDSGGANMYFKKYDNTDNSRMEMPCIWDFDSSYDVEPGNFSRLHTSTHAYFNSLMNSNNREFAKSYFNLWNQKKYELVNSLKEFINNYSHSDEAIALNKSRKLNNKRWNTSYGIVENDAQLTLQWLDNHIEPLNNNIQLINVEYSGIKPNVLNTNCNDKQYYNIGGIKFGSSVNSTVIIQRSNNEHIVRKIINK